MVGSITDQINYKKILKDIEDTDISFLRKLAPPAIGQVLSIAKAGVTFRNYMDVAAEEKLESMNRDSTKILA